VLFPVLMAVNGRLECVAVERAAGQAGVLLIPRGLAGALVVASARSRSSRRCRPANWIELVTSSS
jgi:hypothetical protein